MVSLHPSDLSLRPFKSQKLVLFPSDCHCQVWDIFEDKHLLDTRDKDGNHSNRFHVAEMVAYLGTPPVTFQRRSERTSLVFDETGLFLLPSFLLV
jgi:hypothetical protein